MFTNLVIIIFVPFILAMIFRKLGKGFVNKTEKYYSPISILIIMCIMAGALAKVDIIKTFKDGGAIYYSFFLLFVFTALLYVIGYFIVFRRDAQTKISSSIAMTYMNTTLAIVFAAEFFSAKTLLLVTLYQIPTNIGIISFGYFVKKYIYN
ncbi:unnamed protein product [marine sediment metagenome]|uniref:Uncharacterized protein n=1 Tax=marine sediment metagenome TaxID=412755 RepID=X1B7J2_9ZZZZ